LALTAGAQGARKTYLASPSCTSRGDTGAVENTDPLSMTTPRAVFPELSCFTQRLFALMSGAMRK
jgi:hypothetical protein